MPTASTSRRDSNTLSWASDLYSLSSPHLLAPPPSHAARADSPILGGLDEQEEVHGYYDGDEDYDDEEYGNYVVMQDDDEHDEDYLFESALTSRMAATSPLPWSSPPTLRSSRQPSISSSRNAVYIPENEPTPNPLRQSKSFNVLSSSWIPPAAAARLHMHSLPDDVQDDEDREINERLRVALSSRQRQNLSIEQRARSNSASKPIIRPPPLVIRSRSRSSPALDTIFASSSPPPPTPPFSSTSPNAIASGSTPYASKPPLHERTPTSSTTASTSTASTFLSSSSPLQTPTFSISSNASFSAEPNPHLPPHHYSPPQVYVRSSSRYSSANTSPTSSWGRANGQYTVTSAIHLADKQLEETKAAESRHGDALKNWKWAQPVTIDPSSADDSGHDSRDESENEQAGTSHEINPATSSRWSLASSNADEPGPVPSLFPSTPRLKRLITARPMSHAVAPPPPSPTTKSKVGKSRASLKPPPRASTTDEEVTKEKPGKRKRLISFISSRLSHVPSPASSATPHQITFASLPPSPMPPSTPILTTNSAVPTPPPSRPSAPPPLGLHHESSSSSGPSTPLYPPVPPFSPAFSQPSSTPSTPSAHEQKAAKRRGIASLAPGIVLPTAEDVLVDSDPFRSESLLGAGQDDEYFGSAFHRLSVAPSPESAPNWNSVPVPPLPFPSSSPSSPGAKKAAKHRSRNLSKLGKLLH